MKISNTEYPALENPTHRELKYQILYVRDFRWNVCHGSDRFAIHTYVYVYAYKLDICILSLHLLIVVIALATELLVHTLFHFPLRLLQLSIQYTKNSYLILIFNFSCFQEQIRKRKEEEERIAAQNEFLRNSLRGSRKLHALEDSRSTDSGQSSPARTRSFRGFVNDAYSDDEPPISPSEDTYQPVG